MGNGKNERFWETVSYLCSPKAWNEADNVTKESYAVRKNSETLYYIKEALTQGDWTVVSSSYRTDATGSSGDSYLYKTQSLTSYGQNLGPVSAGNGTNFKAVAGDMWKIDSASLGSDRDIPAGELNRIIYPAALYVSASTPQQRIISSSAGRSWSLLRHDGDLNQNGNQLYLVLDYAGAYWHQTTNTRNSATSSVALISDQAKIFGRSINIVFFYGQPQNSGSTAISTNVRPYRSDEIEFSTDLTYGSVHYGPTNDWNVLTNFNNLSPPHITHLYNEKGGSYTIITEEGTPSFVLGCDMIEDSLSSSLSSKTSVGNTVFMSYSAINRDGLNRSNAAYLSDLFADSRTTADDGVYGTYDYTWFKPIKYFKTVSGASSTPGALITTYPGFGLQSLISATPQGFLSVTQANSTATFDGTYVEFPMPLLDIDTLNGKIRYAGRFADIKLGPAAGINGATARTDDICDRVLIGGVWFPYSGSSGPDL